MQSIVTCDWRSMGSDVQHIEWVLCIDTNAVITVYFLIWCFFCTLHFCLDVIISQNYYVIKFWIYQLLCVLLWWWWNCNFFFILTFLVFHILYKRWELIKKKKEKKVEIIQSHPFSKNRFDNGPLIEDFWSTLSLWRKKRLGWTDYDFWWWFQFMCNVPYAFNHCLCVWVCDPYMCPTGLSLMYKRLCNDLLVHPGFIYYNLLQ